MADKLGISKHNGSDVVYDLCCTICEDDGICQDGRFHCRKCSKYFCDSCVLTHNKFLKDHSVTAKGGGDNWPVTKSVDDTLELCVEHSTEKLTMFCEDHEKLLCQLCLLHNHRQCSQVVLLADKIKSTTQRKNVAKMAKSIEQFQKRLEDVVKKGEQNMKSLQTSYDSVMEEILNFRRQINENLDRLQKNTIINLEQLLSSLKMPLENEGTQCLELISKLNGYEINGSENNSAERSFIMYRKCLDQTASADSFLQNLIKNADIKFQFNKDLATFLNSCTGLGNISIHETAPNHCVDPNKALSITGKSQYNVGLATDKKHCFITGICELVNGEIIIADYKNQCVKLLDPAFNLIEQLQLPTPPYCIFKTSSNEIAVTVGNFSYVTQVQFLRVDERKIVQLNTINLHQKCNGIASHQGDLFLASMTGLSQYTMGGRLVKKLYEHTGGGFVGVGVSPNGKNIYVKEYHVRKLLTLTRDGAVTATLHDPAFSINYLTCNIHVASTGQVFVYGTNSFSQIDTDGKEVLNTTELDISNPGSVYFNGDTSKILVGFYDNDNIIEFKTNVD